MENLSIKTPSHGSVKRSYPTQRIDYMTYTKAIVNSSLSSQ
jgi:hypothetical protein